jgi:hypothetical protein
LSRGDPLTQPLRRHLSVLAEDDDKLALFLCPEAAYQWKFGKGAECVKYAYAAQAITSVTTMRRMVLVMLKRLLALQNVQL